MAILAAPAAPQSGCVVQWGYYVTPSVPAGAQFQSIAAGYESAFALRTDGTLVGWGLNTYGETTIPPGLSNVVAVSACTQCLALKSDGTVAAWGDDSAGMTDVPAGLSNVVAISAAWPHSLALKSDGTVVAWGDNTYGESTVPPGLSNVTTIAAGYYSSWALESNGTVFDIEHDTNIAGLSNVTCIAESGDAGAEAITSDGTVFEISYYDTSSINSVLSNIVAVASPDDIYLQSDGVFVDYTGNPIFTNAVQIVNDAGGGSGTFALLGNGSIIQLGLNYVPQDPLWGYTRNVTEIAAGDLYSLAVGVKGNTIFWSSPSNQFFLGPNDIAAVSVGYGFDLMLTTDGTVLAWGTQISDGQTNVPTNLTGVAAVAAGGYHALALLTNGSVVGWGYDAYGQANGWSFGVAAISAGALHSVALMSNGTVDVVGDNDYGQCDVPEGLNNVMAIAAGGAHNLALQSNGTVVAWGYNEAGQCDVPAGLSNVVAIAAGGDHSLALQANGTVVAWGDNSAGDCVVPSGLGPVIAISAGQSDSMALVLPNLPTLQAQLSGNALLVSWPTNYANLTLQMADSLNTPNWIDCPNPATYANGQFIVTNLLSSTNQFFRLRD